MDILIFCLFDIFFDFFGRGALEYGYKLLPRTSNTNDFLHFIVLNLVICCTISLLMPAASIFLQRDLFDDYAAFAKIFN